MQMLHTMAMYMVEQKIATNVSHVPAQMLFIVGDGRNIDAGGRVQLLDALRVGFSTKEI